MDIQEFNKTIIDEFRANDGVVGGQFSGASLLLLSTTGAKSGLTRVNPVGIPDRWRSSHHHCIFCRRAHQPSLVPQSALKSRSEPGSGKRTI